MGKQTAEQKLLKLIESTEAEENVQSRSEQAPASQEALKILDSVKGVGPGAMALPNFIEQFVAVARNPALLFKIVSSCGVRELNIFLMVGIGIVAVSFLISFSGGITLASKEIHFSVPENVKRISSEVFPSLKGLSEYIEIINRRNIFQPFEQKEEIEEEVAEEVKAAQRINEKTRDFKLVGISWLDTPESAEAMVENKISGITHFLKKGDSLQGMKVKNIYADGITIEFESQELEMRL